jgi:hypothetical protein
MAESLTPTPYRDPAADNVIWPIISDFSDIDQLLINSSTPDSVLLIDHMGGFDINLHNQVLDPLNTFAHDRGVILNAIYQQVLSKKIQDRYPNLNFKFDGFSTGSHLKAFVDYRTHPDVNIQHFLCSFNGSDHVGRKLVTAGLHRRGWFDSTLSTKNFSMEVDTIDGHITDYVGDQARMYRKFFIDPNSNQFFHNKNSVGNADHFSNSKEWGHLRYQHLSNIETLSHIITRCFVHLLSETISTSYAPYISEKFLYGILNRSLFVAYGQPGWHAHVEQYYGFRKYTKIFDYRFDAIINPVERLVALLDELSKFSTLTPLDWRDLYDMEIDTIEFNYDHYHSGNFFRQLEKQYDYLASDI